MRTKSTTDYGIEERGGHADNPVPLHWTVRRDAGDEDTCFIARHEAERRNRKEAKERWEEMTRFRNIFDQKALKEFQLPDGMTPALFVPGEKVYAVRPHLYNPACEKGIVYSVVWNMGAKCWQYEVAWYERVQNAPLGVRKNQYCVKTRVFLEYELYKFHDKAHAREVLINTVAMIYAWWADFEDRLHKLKHGDLKIGEHLK